MSSSALLSVFLRPTCCRCWKATLCSLSLASMKKTNWASTSSMVRYHTRWDHTGTLGCRRHDVGEARSTQEKTVHSDWNRARLGLRTPLEVHRWARASRAPLQNLLWDRFRRPLFDIIVWEDITLFGATGIVGRGDGRNKEIDVSRSPIHRIVGLVGRREDRSWRPGIIRVQAKGLRESWGASVVVQIGRESW